MNKSESNIFAFLSGIIAVLTISVIISEEKKEKKKLLKNDEFQIDKMNMSSDLNNIYSDMSSVRKKLIESA